MTGETAQDQSALRFWQRWSGRYDWFMRRDAALYDAVAREYGRTVEALDRLEA